MEEVRMEDEMDNFLDEMDEIIQSKFCLAGKGFRKIFKNHLQNQTSGNSTIHLYQIEAILQARNKLINDPSLNSPQPCLIVAPTGSGKSGMIVLLPYCLESKKVLILTPSSIISNQLAEAFGNQFDNKNCFLNKIKTQRRVSQENYFFYGNSIQCSWQRG